MAGSQKVFLRIFAIVGDGDDSDAMPDRVPVSGSGRLIPTLATGSGDIAPGPDSIHEVRLIEPIPFLIIDGMLTYDGKPYIWLSVPTGQWQWRIAFDTVRVGDQFRSLRDFLFPLTAATPAQIADEGYPGVNVAQYATGAWEPGTVNLTADAIQQINIMLGRASNAAGDAEAARDIAVANGLRWRGQWEHGTGYVAQDAVSHEGSSWRALSASTGSVPGSGSAWVLLAARGGDGASSWDQVSEKPGSFPSTIALVTGLQAALDGKAATSHTHTWAQISDAPTYSKTDTGDHLVQRAANGHINVPGNPGLNNAPRRSYVDNEIGARAVMKAGTAATLWSGTQAQYDALPTATRNAAGFVAVIT